MLGYTYQRLAYTNPRITDIIIKQEVHIPVSLVSINTDENNFADDNSVIFQDDSGSYRRHLYRWSNNSLELITSQNRTYKLEGNHLVYDYYSSDSVNINPAYYYRNLTTNENALIPDLRVYSLAPNGRIAYLKNHDSLVKQVLVV